MTTPTTPNYAAELINTMQSHNESPSYMVSYLQALIAGFQRDAEAGTLTSKRILEDLDRALEVTTALYNRKSLPRFTPPTH